MKKFLLLKAAAPLLLALFFLNFLHRPAPQAAFAEFLQRYYEDRLRLSPFDATGLGDKRYNDRMPNTLSQAYLRELGEFTGRYRRELLTYDRQQLTPADQTNYDLLRWECEITLENLRYRDWLMPINHCNSVHLSIAQMAAGGGLHPFETPKDYDDWLARLDQYVGWADTALAHTRLGMRQGYLLPRALAEKIVPQLAEFDHGPAEDHLFYEPVKNFPESFSETDKTRLRANFKTAVESKIIPMYGRLRRFFEQEYLPICPADAGNADTPLGPEYYQFLIRFYTTTDMPADDIYQLGLREVARIEQEMEKVKTQLGFQGDLKAFFEHVRTNRALMPYREAGQVLAHFGEIREKIRPNLARLFDENPRMPLDIKRVPAFLEKTASAYYLPGSPDGTRAGAFFVPVPDAAAYNVHKDEALFLHEAIPGHHFQGAVQLEDTTQAEFRKLIYYNAYGEGWALYAESLGRELGLYTDPYQYFGSLVLEMHRALRLVLDVGLHTKGWTREQAIRYSLDRESLDESVITAEVERYMAVPGQALSYKIGQLKISELRARAERALGPRFSLPKFHHQILAPGCVPLAVLEKNIDRWIAEQQ